MKVDEPLRRLYSCLRCIALLNCIGGQVGQCGQCYQVDVQVTGHKQLIVQVGAYRLQS